MLSSVIAKSFLNFSSNLRSASLVMGAPALFQHKWDYVRINYHIDALGNDPMVKETAEPVP
jgi:uncharacterized membrane protein